MSAVAYPLAVENGALVLTGDRDGLVSQALRSSVQTYQGERVMRQGYGISSRPFDEADLPAMLAEVEAAVKIGLRGFSPPVKFRVSGKLEDGGYLVYIDYLSLTDDQYVTEISRVAFV